MRFHEFVQQGDSDTPLPLLFLLFSGRTVGAGRRYGRKTHRRPCLCEWEGPKIASDFGRDERSEGFPSIPPGCGDGQDGRAGDISVKKLRICHFFYYLCFEY